jgi:stage II sporulation protein AA (anti-sigma F factor antagonist)
MVSLIREKFCQANGRMEGLDLDIESRVADGVLFVRLHGELDHHAAEKIRDNIEQALENIRYRGLALSFRGIDFMDSSGLGLILGRYRSVTQHGGRMSLCEVSPPLLKLFELSGLLKIMSVHHSEDEAIHAVKGA